MSDTNNANLKKIYKTSSWIDFNLKFSVGHDFPPMIDVIINEDSEESLKPKDYKLNIQNRRTITITFNVTRPVFIQLTR